MKVIINGLATEYEDEGTGSVLLLLHGWKDNLHTFDLLIPALSAMHRVVRLDLPGFGGTEMPHEPWCVDDYVDFVQAFISKMHLALEGLVGHSFGGRIILKGVAKKAFLSRRIVLIASAGVAKRNTFRATFFKILAKTGKLATNVFPASIRRYLREKLYEKSGSDYLTAGALRETFLNIIKEDLSASAGAIDIPTLLIWGKGDTETPLEEGVRLSRLIPNSRIEVIENAGHFVHQAYPARIAELLEKHLA